MEMINLHGLSIASYDAPKVREAILPLLLDDPLLVISNKSDFAKE